MNKILTTLGLLLIMQSLVAQANEWKEFTALLNQELQYFTAKNGYIQLGRWSYTNFVMTQAYIQENEIFIRTNYHNRFDSDNLMYQVSDYMDIAFLADDACISELSLAYNHDFYYDDFPESVFVKLTTCNEYRISHQSSYQTFLSEDEPVLRVEPQWVNEFYIPVRIKNLPQIIQQLNAYQAKTLQSKLQQDKDH